MKSGTISANVKCKVIAARRQMGQLLPVIHRKIAEQVFLKQHDESVARIENRLAPLFAEQIEQAARELERLGGGVSGKSVNDAAAILADQIFNPREWNADLVNRALPMLAVTMAESMVSQLVELGMRSTKASTAMEWLENRVDASVLEDVVFTTPYGDVSLQFAADFPPWMKDLIETRLREVFVQPYWADINLTTHGDIEVYLRHGLLSGYSISKMASDMRDIFGEEYPLTRGRNIARTEAGNALNGARSDAIDGFIREMQLPLIRKIWLSILGNTTRDTHADLDGVPAAADNCWQLGGIRCRWPGDVNLPAGERCNCQCTLTTSFGMSDATAAELIAEHALRHAIALEIKACGAGGGPGKPGFQPGNTCARGSGTGPGSIGIQAFLAPPKNVSVRYVDAARATAQRILGIGDGDDGDAELSAAIVGLAGAVDNTDVRVSVNAGIDPNRLDVTTEGEGFVSSRSISKGGIYNNYLMLAGHGTGTGTIAFARQVAYASKYGIEKIETFATGSATRAMNGYYTWPRLGYDGTLDFRQREWLNESTELSDSLKSSKRVSDLMKSQEGREWWKANGDSIDVEFDPRPGSENYQVLDAYVKAKFKDQKSVDVFLKNCGAGGGPGKPGFQPGNTCARGSGTGPGSIGIQAFLRRPAGDVSVTYSQSGQDAALELLGPQLQGHRLDEALIGLAGAPVNSELYVVGEMGDLLIETESRGFHSTRRISRDKNGHLYIENDSLEIKDRGAGAGTAVLATQVAFAQKHGIDKITTFAGGNFHSRTMNGYYTWPRLGYDGELKKWHRDKIAASDLPDDVKQSRYISGIMRSPEGRAWWKVNGRSIDLEFDTRPTSESYQVLDTYVKAKFKDQKAVDAFITKACGAGAPGSPGFQPGNTCARGGRAVRDANGQYLPGSMGALSGVSTGNYPKDDVYAQWAMGRIATLERLVEDGEFSEAIRSFSFVQQGAPYSADIDLAQKNLHAHIVKEIAKPIDTSGWNKISSGINPDRIWEGTYEGSDGKIYDVVEVFDHRERTMLLSTAAAAGVRVPRHGSVDIENRSCFAIERIKGLEDPDWDDPEIRKAAADDFAALAWAGHIDALSKNKLKVDPQGRLVLTNGDLDSQVHVLGMSTSASSWGTMQDMVYSPDEAEVFSKMTPYQHVQSAQRLEMLRHTLGEDGLRPITDNISYSTFDGTQIFHDRADAIIKVTNGMRQALNATRFNTEYQASIPPPPNFASSRGKSHHDAALERVFHALYDAAKDGNASVIESVDIGEAYFGASKLKHLKSYKVQMLQAAYNHHAANHEYHKFSKPAATGYEINVRALPPPPKFTSKDAAKVALNMHEVKTLSDMAARGDLLKLMANPPTTPSFKLKTWYNDTVIALSEQMHRPRKSSKIASDEYAKLAQDIHPNKAKGVGSVGYWNTVGGIQGVPNVAPKGKWVQNGTQELWDQGSNAAKRSPHFTLIREYTGTGYYNMNEELRKLEQPSQQSIDVANAVHSTAFPLPNGMMLQRLHEVPGKSVQEFQNMKPGTVLADKGLLSTSTKRRSATGGVIFNITVGNGVRGLPVKKISEHDDENEVILPPNQRIMVTKVETRMVANSMMPGAVVVHGVALPTLDDQCCPP